MSTQDNPYLPTSPGATERGRKPRGDFLADGRRVPASHGHRWLLRGWTTFRMAPGTWMAIAAAFMVLTLLVSASRFLNIGVNLLIPGLIGGVCVGCRALEDGEGIRFAHLFAAFARKPRGLLLVGLLYMLAMLLLAVAVAVVVALTRSGNAFLLPLLTAILFFVPLAMAFWLAPPLVVFHDFPALEALATSFVVTWRNFPPFLLYGALVLFAAVVASLPMLLGWLVLLPVLYASQYAFYRDVFFDD